MPLKFNPLTGEFVNVPAASTGSSGGSSVPLVLTEDFVVPTNTQVLFAKRINAGAYRIVVQGTGVLAGVM
jgi:hypothetical protein